MDKDSEEIWANLHAAEHKAADELETAYQEVEGYNRVLLNQIAGLQDLGLTYVAPLSEGATEPPADTQFGSPDMTKLFLRPDMRQRMMDSGELGVTHDDGDPYVITGELPDRTVQLMNGLLAGIEAQPVKTTDGEILPEWTGNIGGQPIKIVLHIDKYRLITGDKEEKIERTSMWAHKVEDQASNPVPEAELATEPEIPNKSGKTRQFIRNIGRWMFRGRMKKDK